jgi:hypothetical protein
MIRYLSMLRPLARACLKRDSYWLRRSFLWPEQDYKAGMLRRLQKRYGHKFLFETGTYHGDTANRLRGEFEHIYTVEVHPPLYAQAKQRLANFSNITCLLGSGHEAIRDLVPTLKSPTLFWLDSHYSGAGTGMSDEPMPLLRELGELAKVYLRGGGHTVVIDDISSYSMANGNSYLSEILAKLEAIDPSWCFFFDYDMLFALPFEDTGLGAHSFWREIVYRLALR